MFALSCAIDKTTAADTTHPTYVMWEVSGRRRARRDDGRRHRRAEPGATEEARRALAEAAAELLAAEDEVAARFLPLTRADGVGEAREEGEHEAGYQRRGQRRCQLLQLWQQQTEQQPEHSGGGGGD